MTEMKKFADRKDKVNLEKAKNYFLLLKFSNFRVIRCKFNTVLCKKKVN